MFPCLIIRFFAGKDRDNGMACSDKGGKNKWWWNDESNDWWRKESWWDINEYNEYEYKYIR